MSRALAVDARTVKAVAMGVESFMVMALVCYT